jgi:hypothetical protein
MTTILIDIETLPVPEHDCVWELLASKKFTADAYPGPPANYKSADKIAAHQAKWVKGLKDKQELARLQTSLDGKLGRIACIGLSLEVKPGIFEREILHPPHADAECWGMTQVEHDLLNKLTVWARSRANGEPIKWVGWNVGFDLGFLRLRALRYNNTELLHLLGPLDAKPWEAAMDLQRVFPGRSTFGSERLGSSLVDAWMAITGMTDDDTTGVGAKVYEQWIAGNTIAIIDHCTFDMAKTEDLYLRLAPFCKQ